MEMYVFLFHRAFCGFPWVFVFVEGEADIEVEFYDQFATPSEIDSVAFGMTFLDLFAWFCAIIMVCITLGVMYGLFGKYIPMWKDKKDAKSKKDKAAKAKQKADKLKNDPIAMAKAKLRKR